MDFVAAVRDFTRYFGLGGGDVWIYRKRAEAYEKLGDNSRADADYDKAAALKLAAKGASGWLGVSLASLTEDEAKGQAGLRRACPYGA
jgi:Flp pilus assembly protein TadD